MEGKVLSECTDEVKPEGTQGQDELDLRETDSRGGVVPASGPHGLSRK